MKTLASLMLAGALIFAFGHSGYAQMQMSPPATPAAPGAPKAPVVPSGDILKKAKAKECSTKADAQKLHGKARWDFRAKCIKG